MGTVDQPKPSEPKSIQPDQRPLEPGQTTAASKDQVTPERTNYQSPDTQKDKFGDRDR